MCLFAALQTSPAGLLCRFAIVPGSGFALASLSRFVPFSFVVSTFILGRFTPSGFVIHIPLASLTHTLRLAIGIFFFF